MRMIRITKLKDDMNEFTNKKLKYFSSNAFAKLIVCIIIGIGMFIPIYIAAALYFILSPVGFWQLITFFALSIFFLTAPQLLMFCGGVFLILSVIEEA